jgi:hypothetical protein
MQMLEITDYYRVGVVPQGSVEVKPPNPQKIVESTLLRKWVRQRATRPNLNGSTHGPYGRLGLIDKEIWPKRQAKLAEVTLRYLGRCAMVELLEKGQVALGSCIVRPRSIARVEILCNALPLTRLTAKHYFS